MNGAAWRDAALANQALPAVTPAYPSTVKICPGCGEPAYQRKGIAGPPANPLCGDFENLLDEFIRDWC